MGKSILGFLFDKVLEAINENASTPSTPSTPSTSSTVSRQEEEYVYRSIDEWVDYFKSIINTNFPDYTLK